MHHQVHQVLQGHQEHQALQALQVHPEPQEIQVKVPLLEQVDPQAQLVQVV